MPCRIPVEHARRAGGDRDRQNRLCGRGRCGACLWDTGWRPATHCRKIGDCEECGAIGFHRSPDRRWILIEVRYQVHRQRHLALRHRHPGHARSTWSIPGTENISRPNGIPIAFSKCAGPAWATAGPCCSIRRTPQRERRSATFFCTMPNAMFTCTTVMTGKRRRMRSKSGPCFHRAARRSDFPIALDVEYRSDAIHQFESVGIDGPNVVVTYDTKTRGRVRERFSPRVLRNAR